MKKTIFVIDDSNSNLAKAEEALEKHYLVITLSSAEKMFTALKKFKPNLILLDIAMPEMSGFDAIKRLKASESYAEIPVIFLTALTDSFNEAYGIELGAVDFITKPFSEPALLNRIRNHLHIDEVIRERTAQLHERTEHLLRLKNCIVYTLAELVESRDKNTGGHIDRTSAYMRILIDAMLARGIYADEMADWDIDSVASSTRLHDVGKIAIPDHILNKPGPLTKEEMQTMKMHCAEGERIINSAMQQAGDAEFLRYAKQIITYHHERWDGSGYNHRLKGTEIPLLGRLMAVVDAYDALVSERPYKKASTHEDAVRIIMEDAGGHFDPLIVEVFDKVQDQIMAAGVGLSR